MPDEAKKFNFLTQNDHVMHKLRHQFLHLGYANQNKPMDICSGQVSWLIISPNEVFGDIMVLASPPRPPVDPDNVNALTRKIFNGSLSKSIWG